MTKEDINRINSQYLNDCENTEEMEEIFDLAIKALEQEPKSEWEHDHEILKAYSDGANEVLDKVRAEIDNTLSDGMIHKKTVLGIIDKCKAESEG